MTINKKVTIVIVSYNGRKDLPECLESLEHQDYPRSLVKIIVVDNNSKDSTIGWLKEVYPNVKVVINQKNIGFAKANNQGYLLAKKQQSDYLQAQRHLLIGHQNKMIQPQYQKLQSLPANSIFPKIWRSEFVVHKYF